MKRIVMLTSVAGTEYAYAAGQEVDVQDHIADDLIRGGHARPIAVSKPAATAEKAVSKPAATAEKR